jgi:molybdopterin converting factor small subunit
MTTGTTTTVELRFFAAARAALGRPAQRLDLETGTTVADVLADLAVATPGAAPVLRRCAVLLDGRRVADPATAVVPDGARLDLLPPFAGG